MSNPTNCPLRTALAIGISVAFLGAPLGAAGASERADTAAPFQLAQGGPKAAAPPSRPAPQAQAPAPVGEQGIDKEITELRKRLNITPQQQPQFDALAQAMRQNSQSMDALTKQQEQPGAVHNAVEDLRAAAKFSETEAEGLKRLLPPLQALYESLSDPQKKTADQVMSSAAGGDQPPPPPQGKKR